MLTCYLVSWTVFFLGGGLSEVLFEDADLPSVEMSADGEDVPRGSVEGIHGRVGAVAVVCCLDLHIGVVGPRDLNIKLVSAKGFVVASLVLRLDGEREDSKAGLVGISALNAEKLDGHVLDRLSSELDVQIVNTCKFFFKKKGGVQEIRPAVKMQFFF